MLFGSSEIHRFANLFDDARETLECTYIATLNVEPDSTEG